MLMTVRAEIACFEFGCVFEYVLGFDWVLRCWSLKYFKIALFVCWMCFARTRS